MNLKNEQRRITSSDEIDLADGSFFALAFMLMKH